MGWNGNDIQYLSTIDRVKRLERSTLKPNESGDYDETSPNLTERVVALEEATPMIVYKNGDTLPTPEVGTVHTYQVVAISPFVSGANPTLEVDSVNSYVVDGNILTVSNVGGTISLLTLNGGTLDDNATDLTISSTYLALKRVSVPIMII